MWSEAGDRAAGAARRTRQAAADVRQAASGVASDVRQAGAEKLAEAKQAGADALAKVKPRLRGVSHQYAFFVSLVLGAILVIAAPTTTARIATAIYALSVSGLFGTSALYHRINWSPGARRWMRRADHSMIFVLIAGTYTPFALIALQGTMAIVVLVGVWAGALLAVVLQLVWIDAPKWLTAVAGIALGWFALIALPDMASALSGWALALVGLGGLLYTAGAIVYATRRPDPAPTVFGYHEIFHALTIVAALAQFAAIAFFVLPAAS